MILFSKINRNLEGLIMLIDFNRMDSMTFPGMNNGTGTMSARMYNDDSYRIIPTAIHPGGSIGTHKQESGDDLNYIISGTGKAICNGVEEELNPGVCISAQMVQNTLSSIPETKIW